MTSVTSSRHAVERTAEERGTITVLSNAFYRHKLAPTTFGTSQVIQSIWQIYRILTPADMLFIKDGCSKYIVFIKSRGAVKVFTASEQREPQGLIVIDGRIEAATVATTVRNLQSRNAELRKTFIQFDADKVDDENADFKVYARNRRETIFYSGCHLIDYQFCAGNAHSDRDNYFAGNYFYNSPLKEWLVKRSIAFVEIPVYTPNPPRIEAKRGEGYYPIPACVFFIQICPERVNGKNKIVMYCFPNNRFDYEDLQVFIKLR